ncbi:MAG TPA: indolepyruvate oxidoreductase subunit beta family protein [Methylomirabilota bacterium]|nr:indolepyruvate oxidoreductase subunit beta family protein [Methylomirabilota bacterium]
MTAHDPAPTPVRLSTDKPLAVAVLAMGGQGGGVLADWMVALAEAEGWVAQATSVPGVAQRTGATIYYIEMLPARDGVQPVLSLMPTPGDVDVVLAAEFMEAGRSVLRGLVTPDRTTLIASSHRAFAVAEKERPGDGVGDPRLVVDAADIAARRTISFDMQAVAEANGSVISSALFGALAASGVLPFPREAFERTVTAGGKGVEASLRTFAAAFDRARETPREAVSRTPAKRYDPLPDSAGHPALDALLARIQVDVPEPLRTIVYAGVKRLTDFQDAAYADAYLDRIAALMAADVAAGGEARDLAFTAASAKYVAVAMAYDDVIRVADLKVRASRFERIKLEAGVRPDQIVYTTEFMHPRMEEVTGTLPKRLGLWLERRPRLFKALDRVVNRGRRVRTNTVFWFLGLSVVAGMKPRRLATLRHARESEHMEAWLARATDLLPTDYALAVAVLKARRLVKGYADTNARGHSKFDRVMAAVPLLQGREDAADWLDRLTRAALMDEDGKALDGAVETVRGL